MMDKPLSIDQKLDLLNELQKKLKEPDSVMALENLLHSAIVKDDNEGFPKKIARFIYNFAGPYLILEDDDLERQIYDEQVVQPQVKKHALKLFEACCKVAGWGSARLLEIADHLNITVKPSPLVKVAIYRGKLYWKIYFEEQILDKYNNKNKPVPIVDDNTLDYITMTLDDFKQFRNAGKRNGRASILKYTDADKQEVHFDMSRPNRNPRYNSGPNDGDLDHSDVNLCHTCAWDVDEYQELKHHRESNHRNSDLSCDLHDHENPNFQLKYDHIPSFKHLESLNIGNESKMHEEAQSLVEGLEALEVDEAEEGNSSDQHAMDVAIYMTSEKLDQVELRLEELTGLRATLFKRGFCIAAPSIWDERGRTMKAKNITHVDHDEETDSPDKAVRRDIKNYIRVLRENHESSASLLLRFGAFRYLYRKNGKREQAYYSVKTDRFFTRELKEIIESKDCGRPPAPDLVPSPK